MTFGRLFTTHSFTNSNTKFILNKLAKNPEEEATAMKQGLEKPEGPTMMGLEEAWAHMILTDRTVAQYKLDRKMQIKHKAVHYPG